MISRETQLGNASVAFVEGHLTLEGLVISRAPEGAVFDLSVRAGDKTYYVQVKSTAVYKENRKGKYFDFHTTQREGRKEQKRIAYSITDVDIFACVGFIDKENLEYLIAFFPNKGQRWFRMKVDGIKDYSFGKTITMLEDGDYQLLQSEDLKELYEK